MSESVKHNLPTLDETGDGPKPLVQQCSELDSDDDLEPYNLEETPKPKVAPPQYLRTCIEGETKSVLMQLRFENAMYFIQIC